MSSTKTLSVFLKLNSKEFTSGLKKVEGKLGKFSKNINKVGSSLTTNISLPLLGIGAAAVKTASEFDASMTKIQTLVGASASEVKELENSVLDLAGETAQAPKDLADGLFFIQSAGFKGKESLDALEVSAKGAAMGMGEMTDISNALTSIMTGYADENMTAARAGDLLHETLKQGKFEAGDFMSKLGSVIPTAASFGISFEQLGASVATMSKLSGDAAGSLTAVNKLMMSLNAPAEQQSKILNQVFGSYDNLSKSLKSDFAGTLGTIFEALEGNDQELIKVFGSVNAVKAAFATAGLQGETYTEVLEGMNNSLGNVDEGFAITSETSAFKFKQAIADLQVAGIRLGESLMPIATKIAESFSNMANSFSGMSEKSRERIVKLGLALVALGPTLMIISKLIKGFQLVVKVVRIARTALVAARAVMMAMNPVGAIIAGIVGVVALLIHNFQKVKPHIVKVINFFVDLYNESMVVRVAVEGIKFAFKSIFEAAKFYVGQIANIFSGLGNALVDLLNFRSPKESLKKMFNDMKGTTEKFATNTQKNIDDMMEGISGRKKVKVISEGDIDRQLNNAKKKINDFVDGIKDATGTAELFTTDEGEVEDINVDIDGTLNTDDITYEGENPEVDVEGNLDTETMNEQLREVGQSAQSAFSQMANAGADDNSLVDNIKAQTREIISAKVAEATASFAADAFGKLGILGAVLAASAGSVVGALFNQIIPPFAEGGIVSGPTLAMVGEGRGTSSINPEVIAPLDKLKGMIGGGRGGKLHGRISGSDILLSNDRAVGSRNRVAGSGTTF
tara:strand:+ start:1542 stop:3926 length:2385 start_codon:yes stop_codon:yes gene_type:complete